MQQQAGTYGVDRLEIGWIEVGRLSRLPLVVSDAAAVFVPLLTVAVFGTLITYRYVRSITCTTCLCEALGGSAPVNRGEASALEIISAAAGSSNTYRVLLQVLR